MNLNNKINTNQTNEEKYLGIPSDISRINELTQLLDIGKQIIGESDLNHILSISIDKAIEISGAERGLIIFFDEDGHTIFETARNINKNDIKNPRFEIIHTFIKQVKLNSRSIYLQNALENPEFGKSRSIDRLKILSIICIPIKYMEKIFGVVYLDNRTVAGSFEKEVFNFTESFTNFISIAAYKALEKKQLDDRVAILEDQLRSQYDFESIIGHSEKMMQALKIVSQVADTQVPVLIEGETGTGKELIARAIHFNSPRRDNSFVSVNCGAFPENLLESEFFGHEKGAFTGAIKSHKGKFEQAEGGTIFLDEVEEMSSALQVKLLRVLQWGEIHPLGSEEAKICDVRVVAASKEKLDVLVKKGSFRDDLYYRLNLVRIEIPALRERCDDILLLSNHFLKKYSEELKMSIPEFDQEVEKILLNYNFPGNVRELENIIQHAVIMSRGSLITTEHLPRDLSILDRSVPENQSQLKIDSFNIAKQKVIENFEKHYLQKVLQESNGIVVRAAKLAGIHNKNFHDKLKKYNISPIKKK